MPDRGQEETVRIVAMDKSFHVDCYRCEVRCIVIDIKRITPLKYTVNQISLKT